MPACPGGRVSGLGRINDPAQVYVEVIHRALPMCEGDARGELKEAPLAGVAAVDLAPEGEQLEEALEDRGPRRRPAAYPPSSVGLARGVHDPLQQRGALALVGLGLGLGLGLGIGIGFGFGFGFGLGLGLV